MFVSLIFHYWNFYLPKSPEGLFVTFTLLKYSESSKDSRTSLTLFSVETKLFIPRGTDPSNKLYGGSGKEYLWRLTRLMNSHH